MSKEKLDTKKCKHCQSDIPYNAKVCPNCRKKQGGGALKWALIVIVVLVIGAFALSGDSDSEKPSNSSPKKVSENTESVDKKDSDEETKIEDGGEDQAEKEFAVGDVVQTSDLKISFLNAEKYKSDNEFMQPEKGNVFYKMDFEFENISDSDENVSSWDFTCYADGYDTEQHYMDGMDLDATLSPGKKTKGSVFFEVPKGSEEITLEYETNFWSESKVVFKVK